MAASYFSPKISFMGSISGLFDIPSYLYKSSLISCISDLISFPLSNFGYSLIFLSRSYFCSFFHCHPLSWDEPSLLDLLLTQYLIFF